MSEAESIEQFERLKVVCPHCKKPMVVKVPVNRATLQPVPPPENRSVDKGEYTDWDGPLSEEEIRFRERVIDTILRKEFELPLLPHVAIKVIQISNDSKSSMQDIAKVIMTDQMMTTKIIKLANSPVFAGTIEVTNIKQALVRVGQSEVRNLMLAISLGSKVFRSNIFGSVAQNLWEHAVGAAFAARVISHGLRLDRELSFLSGLVHDLGKMILLNILETSQRRERKGFKSSKSTIFDIWDQYQSDVGVLAAEAWKLPEETRSVIRYHRAFDEMDDNPIPLVWIVALADEFCRIKGIGQETEEIDLEESEAARMLNLTPNAGFELLERFYRLYDEMKSDFI